jgi:hypothetical protein
MSYTQYAQRSAPVQSVQGGHPSQPSPPPSPYAPTPLSPPTPMMTQMPTARPSLFGAMPCPHCGQKMAWRSDRHMAAMRWFGLVGILLIYPWTAKYICPQHGEVSEAVFPPAHKSVAGTRKALSTITGLVLLVLAIWLLTVLW